LPDGAEGRCLGQGQEPKELMDEGQSIHRKGLVWSEVRKLAQGAAATIKGSFIFNYHSCANCIVYIINVLPCYSYLSPLQIENKPCDGVTKHAIVPGPVSLVANKLKISEKCYFDAKSDFF
jgi:hypothetical protein